MTTTNTLKTVALLGLLSALLIVGGQLLAGRSGMYFGLVMAVVMNFGSYFFSEKIALSTYNAQPVTPTGPAAISQSHGTTPLPAWVSSTGIRWRSARSRRADSAPA